jgi:hypothetical protein
MSYTPFGPWTNGGPPGISAAFLTALESFLVLINSAATDSNVSASSGIVTAKGLATGTSLMNLATHNTVKNGSTSGTMTVSEFFTGGTSLKITLVNFNNYKNAGSANSVVLNAAYTNGGQIIAGFTQGLSFVSGGSTQGISVITALGNSSDGSSTTVSTIFSHSIGQVGPYDTIKENGGNAVARSGQVVLIGY